MFLLPHPTFHACNADYFHTVCRVQYAKESMSHHLGTYVLLIDQPSITES